MIWVMTALLVASVGQLVFLLAAFARLRSLTRDASPAPAAWPRLSIVIPARNEERHLKQALASVLDLDYPDFEVIVINDRSEDRTGAILSAMAAGHPTLRRLDIAQLPQGWLGKNHALHEGARVATGEWILFTDADVVFRPETLRRTLAYVVHQRLDHLALLARIWSRSRLLDSFISFFGVGFLTYTRPWRARDPKAREFIGIGAFNLVRAEALRAVGGFEKIRMRPDDDIRLGQILKQAGFRQDVLTATHEVSVEWYASLGECARGLEKNVFAGMNYRTAFAIPMALMPVLFSTMPAVLALVLALTDAGSTLGAVSAAVYGVQALSMGLAAGFMGSSPLYGPLVPLNALLLSVIFSRAIFKNLAEGGIRWRGTFYSLKELKENRL